MRVGTRGPYKARSSTTGAKTLPSRAGGRATAPPYSLPFATDAAWVGWAGLELPVRASCGRGTSDEQGGDPVM